MARMWNFIGCFTLLALCSVSCDLINPEEEIPAYIYIEPFEFSTTTAEGSASEQITEAWVSADGIFLGAYSLPALVPILEKPTALTIAPGIHRNGIPSTPDIYQFYEPYVVSLPLNPAEVDTIRPETRYIDNVKFSLLEDFERGNFFFREDLDGNLLTSLRLSSDDAFEGNGCGRIQLDSINNVVEIATDLGQVFTNLQSTGLLVYLELNYKTDVEIGFGLVGNFDTGNAAPEKLYEPILRAQDEWNKVYLDLTPIFGSLMADNYQITLVAAMPSNLGEAEILLDNIKLVHL